MTEEDYMTVAEATEHLEVGNKKMAKLLKEGTLPWQLDPLDRRSKLIKQSASSSQHQAVSIKQSASTCRIHADKSSLQTTSTRRCAESTPRG